MKAGSWGARTVEKIVRATESALREELPVFWFVDSAGARITDQVEMFPGRRGAGPDLPQPGRAVRQGAADLLPVRPESAAGGAYIPAFCDIVIMVEGNASMYLGSPRMAEMVVGERVTLEEMGGARMHCTVSGCGDLLAADDAEAIEQAKLYFSYLPGNWRERAAGVRRRASRRAPLTRDDRARAREAPFDMHEVIDGLVDDDSFFEIKPLFAAELVVGFGRMDGRDRSGSSPTTPRSRAACCSPTAPTRRPGSSGCATRSRSRCVYLADVPGFMIGTEVERGGIIRHGAKMVTAVASATVPQFCVVVRKAYGAGLYAMGGPGFAPDATHRAAHRADRRDGPGGRGQRGLRQQDRRDRATRASARRVRRRAARASTRRTSTSNGWPPTSSSTASSRPTSCAPSCCAGCATPRAATGRSANGGGPSRRLRVVTGPSPSDAERPPSATTDSDLTAGSRRALSRRLTAPGGPGSDPSPERSRGAPCPVC